MSPEYIAYRTQLRRFAWPLRTGGLGLILVGAGLLVASKGEPDPTLGYVGISMLAMGWGLWGYVMYARARWAKANPFTGPRE